MSLAWTKAMCVELTVGKRSIRVPWAAAGDPAASISKRQQHDEDENHRRRKARPRSGEGTERCDMMRSP
jgi:hypothetical protein